MNTKQLLIGIVTFLPGMSGARKLNVFSTQSRKASNATSGRYGYSVWMRHLVLAAESGLNADPRIVAELGPGASLGMGLAAVLSGVDRYYAFDVVAHANVERNLRALDELMELFHQRADIPGESEFPSSLSDLIV